MSIFHRTSRLVRVGGAKDGVAVEKNNQLIANLECQDIPVSKLSEEFFTHAGLSADQNEFQIPGLD
ncbi:hypothetical protein [Nitrosomonas sp.]|uniref:hypothetical protein n=1 Tax=Nitrosomonas sp. TaxID=42353 RepID=UPI002731E0A1|nr:hypothetical protein [Nitrosomonas sp.]MDP2225575.1 hypothetical protein [Nitrosomonas sp.]